LTVAHIELERIQKGKVVAGNYYLSICRRTEENHGKVQSADLVPVRDLIAGHSGIGRRYMQAECIKELAEIFINSKENVGRRIRRKSDRLNGKF
jgi:hypothetical protein